MRIQGVRNGLFCGHVLVSSYPVALPLMKEVLAAVAAQEEEEEGWIEMARASVGRRITTTRQGSGNAGRAGGAGAALPRLRVVVAPGMLHQSPRLPRRTGGVRRHRTTSLASFNA